MHANIGKLHGRKQRTMEWVSSSVTSIRSQQSDIERITRAFEELAQSVRERQAEHLLHLGNQSVQSSESARQESEQLGSNVDQAQLLTIHFLQMLCDKLLNKGAQASTRQFPEPAQ